MMRLRLWLILSATCLSGCSGPHEWSAGEKRFYEALSSPLIEWSPSSFGYSPVPYERALLKAYKPKIFISPQGLGPVDFYEDYLPHAELVDHRGRVASRRVNRNLLKSFERSPGFQLRYQGRDSFCKGAACKGRRTRGYGQVHYGDVDLGEGARLHFSVLKYNFVFPYSGLPARLSRVQEWLSGFVGNPDYWHELDIHGAIHIFVSGTGGAIYGTARPT